MEKIISLNDNQVEKIDIIDNYFVQKQNELRAAMWQTEKIYSNAPESFVAWAIGKIFVGNQNEPLIVFPDIKSELFSEKHLVTAKVMDSLTDSEYEETVEFCAATKNFLSDWTWNKEDTVDLLNALKSANTNVQNKFLFNMSKRSAQMVREDMEYMGEVKSQDSYNSQQKILEAIHDLEKSGEIEIPRLTYADRNEK